MFSRPGIFAGADVMPLSNPGLAEALLQDKPDTVMGKDTNKRDSTDDDNDNEVDYACTFVHELVFVLATMTTYVHHGIILCA